MSLSAERPGERPPTEAFSGGRDGMRERSEEEENGENPAPEDEMVTR